MDAHVDIDELGNMMTLLDEETWRPEEFLDYTNTNGYGLIEFEEFYLIKSHHLTESQHQNKHDI